MIRLRRVMGTVRLWAMPRRVKEARIDRAMRRMVRSFSQLPWPDRYHDSGYQVLSSQGDPWISEL